MKRLFMMSKMGAPGRWAAALVVVGLGGLLGASARVAAAAPLGRQQLLHVQKGRAAASLHVYWASPLSDHEVLVTPYLEHTSVDTQFEIIDQRGYVGRARVHHVEMIQGGCPSVHFWNGTATVEGNHDTPQSQPVMVALPVSKRDLSHARVLLPEDLHNVPRFDQRKFPDVGLDLDGNGVADVVRYYYDCPPPPGASYSYGYCMDVLAREKGDAWSLLETVVVPECY
jgi:hypothetical protein